MLRVSNRLPTFATFALLAAVGLAGCAGDSVGSNAADLSDSFNHPTDHGELVFGSPNQAEFTDESRFHAWSFSLTAEAELDLRTELQTQNLDTVMYLYRRTDSGWGSSIAKNDDDAGALSSRIAGSFAAGEYRVKIKAAKTALRGSFSLIGACTGAGCPQASGGECTVPDATLPAATGFSSACAAKFEAVVTSPTGAVPASCDALGSAAVEYYKQYWDGIYGYDELTGGEDVEPDVDIQHHPGSGTVVNVGLGGDEDAMDFVFDASGALVFYYQHNQSPDWAWFCGSEGTALPEPDEDCAAAIVGHSDYRVEDVSEGSGVAPSGEVAGLSAQVGAAVEEYVATRDVAPTADVAYAFTAWAGTYVEGAEVTVSAEGSPEVTYVVVGDPQWGLTIALVTDASGTSFVCKEL
jgi:hypothetical protein